MGLLVIVLVLMAFSAANSMPADTSTTARSADTLKKDVELMDNSTQIMLDTRTPPKIKQHSKKKPKPVVEEIENSHAGVAIPIEEDQVHLEATTKKFNFYKVERPTTNTGLSTWILLSGSSTPTPTRKPIIKPAENITTTVVDKIIKPIFKKRLTTTRKPTTTTTTTAKTVTTTVTPTVTTTKLTKIKASVLSTATSKKTTTTPTPMKKSEAVVTTTLKTTVEQNNTTATNSSSLPVEAKDTETELDDKKTRRPSNKRKKNKNRRRRPAQDKADGNSTKIAHPAKNKEKPIGTQLYNYLSREVMPTVGVGLVGLVVTAGLASYFLYPFSVARRSYEIDRKDKEGSYYYNDEYSGGIAEEEAIGKVIAGMPSNSVYGSSYKTPTSRNSFNNAWNRQNTYEQSKETGYTVDDSRFVVGNTPKIDATPAAVPEHGPRSLKTRKRRQTDQENEIFDEFTTATTPGLLPTSTPSSTSTKSPEEEKISSFVSLFRDLFKMKIRLGLQLLQNATQAVSKYVSHVQKRLDSHYNRTMTKY